MTDLSPPAKSVSLDDLLNANKSQFDSLFSQQMAANGLVETSLRPPMEADLASNQSLIRQKPSPSKSAFRRLPVPL